MRGRPWWSPKVAVGRLTVDMALIEKEWEEAGRDLRFVINGEYTERIRALIDHASGNTSTTNEPAYRLLQILTHLQGGNLAV